MKNIWEQKNKICLNLGAGLEAKKGFINVDKFYTLEDLKSNVGIFKQSRVDKDAKYIKADILHLPFKDSFADYVELFNVIEHLPMKGVIEYIKEIRRVMKTGAKLLIITNNMDGLALDWLDLSIHPPFNYQDYINVAETIYGNQFAEGEIHRCPFTPTFMDAVLSSAGFTNGQIFVFKRGSKVPPLGSTKPLKSRSVFRNDIIYVECVK